MIRMNLLTFCFLFTTLINYSQENIVSISHPDIELNKQFKPIKNEAGNWGVQDINNQKYIIEPKYKLLGDFIPDSFYIFVDKTDKYGAVNSNGSIKIPFDYYGGSLIINNFDTSYAFNEIQVWPYKIYGEYTNQDSYLYCINSNKQCIPRNYYTCPANTNIDWSSATTGMKEIQKAEYFKSKNLIDSAVFYCNEAILKNPMNPYFYYWGCKLLLANDFNKLTAKSNQKYKKHFDWLESCILRAEELEKDIHYLYRIKSLKYNFYSYNIVDKTKAKKTKSELKVLKSTIKQGQNPSYWIYGF